MASTVWRGYITFGLISIPVRLYRAARAERVTFRRLHREEPSPSADQESSRAELVSSPEVAAKGAMGRSGRRTEPQLTLVPRIKEPDAPAVPVLTPVRQASIREGSDEVVPAQSVVKGYEYEKNRFVAIEPEELKSAAAQTSSEMEIQEFVKLADIDPVYFETSYYVSPEGAGEKAYALLYKSMQSTALVAVGQFAMHNREHVVVLRPGQTGMLAHTMFFASEVRSEEEYRTDTSVVTEKELNLGRTLVDSLAAPFQPEKYHDTYRERLEALIAAKVKGQAPSLAEAPQKRAHVVDLTEALNKSLANLKKPAASEQQTREPITATPPKGKRTSRPS